MPGAHLMAISWATREAGPRHASMRSGNGGSRSSGRGMRRPPARRAGSATMINPSLTGDSASATAMWAPGALWRAISARAGSRSVPSTGKSPPASAAISAPMEQVTSWTPGATPSPTAAASRCARAAATTRCVACWAESESSSQPSGSLPATERRARSSSTTARAISPAVAFRWARSERSVASESSRPDAAAARSGSASSALTSSGDRLTPAPAPPRPRAGVPGAWRRRRTRP